MKMMKVVLFLFLQISVEDLFKEYITKQLEVQGGNVVENDQAFLIDVKKEQANAKNGEVRRLPVFIGKKMVKLIILFQLEVKDLGCYLGYVAMDDQHGCTRCYF